MSRDNASRLAAFARQRAGAWAGSAELKEYLDAHGPLGAKPKRVGPHITISREAGAGADEIAHRVGRELDWDVLGHELLMLLAEKDDLPDYMLDCVDETEANWIRDIFGEWLDPKTVSHTKYVWQLKRLVWLAAIHGRVVFVGRGAQFVLPPENGLHVRLIGSQEARAARRAESGGCSVDDARARVTATDAERKSWVKRFFEADVENPHAFDLVLNTDRLSVDGAARLIVEASRALGGA